jgi:hypothetical protein
MTCKPMTCNPMTRKLTRQTALLLVAGVLAGPVQAQSSGLLSTDNRIVINVSQAEKNQVLAEMREFLHGFHNMHLALARQDMKSLAVTARPMGPLLDRLPGSLKERLPEEFTQLAIAMNEAFQNLARDAGNGESKPAKTHENMAEVMTYCSGCHDTYRFNVVPMKARK